MKVGMRCPKGISHLAQSHAFIRLSNIGNTGIIALKRNMFLLIVGDGHTLFVSTRAAKNCHHFVWGLLSGCQAVH